MLRAEAAARRITDIFFASRRASLTPRSEEWLSLEAAARMLQAAQQGSDADRLSRGLSQSDETLLAFWAHRVAQMGVAIYGCRVMSSRPEAVPQSELLDGRFINRASRLNRHREQPLLDFCVLQVRRRDLDACLEEAARVAGF